MDDHCCTKGAPRRGAALEHGAAHLKDHLRWSRRDFLVRMGVASAGVAFSMGGAPMNAFSQAPLLNALHQADTDRVLVLLQLQGGNDGLNTVVPTGNDNYYRARPTIAIPRSKALSISDSFSLHPALSSVRPLWDKAQMSVVHNVGYADQSHSHFRGTDVWTSASDVDDHKSTGWTGRYLADRYPDLQQDPPAYPLAVRVGGASASLFQSSTGNLGMTFANAGQFGKFLDQGGFYDTEDVPQTAYGDALKHVRSVTNDSYRYVEAVEEAAQGVPNKTEYPDTRLGNNLSVVARLVRGDLGARVFAVAEGSFDTHNEQGGAQGAHADRLRTVGEAISALYDDLAQSGLADRVLVMTFSEFGRTLAENSSAGTDHGAAAPILLFGKGLKGGRFGSASTLEGDDLYGGDPRFKTDYRTVYQTILEDWFGLNKDAAAKLLGRSHGTLDFIADPISIDAEAPSDRPSHTQLLPNYPNPFRRKTTIPFVLKRSAPVHLKVYDMQGRLVRTLADTNFAPGRHTLTFHARQLPAGTYLCRLRTPNETRTRPLVHVH